MDYSHASKDTVVYRGIESGKAEKSRTPAGANINAFKRKSGDSDGLSLFSSPELCWQLNITTVVKLQVSSVNSVFHGSNGQPMTVVQESDEHLLLVNVPGYSANPDDAKVIEDAATDLHAQCNDLDQQEWSLAKVKGEEIKRQRIAAALAAQPVPPNDQN